MRSTIFNLILKPILVILHTSFPHIIPVGFMLQYIRPKVTVDKCKGIIIMQVLFKRGSYMMKDGM